MHITKLSHNTQQNLNKITKSRISHQPYHPKINGLAPVLDFFFFFKKKIRKKKNINVN